MIKLTLQIFSEIGLILFSPISAIMLKFVPKHLFEAGGNGANIVIVERWINFNIIHLYWKRYLQKNGFKVYIINFPLYRGDFEKSSRLLDKFLSSKKLRNVTLVGISSGGITSLLYLQERNGWKRVNRFISVGSPFKGTFTSFFLIFMYSGRELFSWSPLIKKIRSYDIKNPEKILCIYAKADEMVLNGTFLKNARICRINIIGHNNLHLASKSTYKNIIEAASR